MKSLKMKLKKCMNNNFALFLNFNYANLHKKKEKQSGKNCNLP